MKRAAASDADWLTKVTVGTEKKSNGGNGFAVGNSFAVIGKKRQPTLSTLWFPRCTAHPTRDRVIRYIKTEHERIRRGRGRAPEGFSATIFKIRSRVSVVTGVLPTALRTRETNRQYHP
jgi:hypothetical protein